ncbi:PucR family transcriptional regulator [Alicyclobacillus sp. SO9]|uniref:PucR family transcriptional regulator n=1 Tax=Alicyclobacillus sp. SO9 TaxID=2665646 RepID=UPI0018E89E39|nr:PucR family transcriptional regulator [Alicyclobacillus sp. SO9]QQE79030.1 PucR family transcriptional regulator ligand-binding domain-containing protein [Alicyclobacillus sp. SO9]
MEFCVSDTLQLEIMQPATLLTGHNYVQDYPVESVSVIEMPVEDFVRPNEFVLTTGVGCGDDEQVFKDFVAEIMEGHAACIGIAVGRHVKAIPASVVNYAEERSFPIVEIPWKVRFSDIIHDLLAAMNSRHRLLIMETDTVQQELLSLVLNSANLSAIADFLEEQTDIPVIVVDRRNNLVGQSKDAQELANRWRRTSEAASTTYPPSIISPVSAAIEPMVYRMGQHRFLKVPVRSTNEIQGYLILALPNEVPVDSFLPMERAHLFEHAAAAAALCFLRINLIEETESRLRHDFIWDLIRGEEQPWDTVVAQSKFLGYDLRQHHVCTIASFDNLEALYHEGKYETSVDTWSENILSRIESLFIDTGLMSQRNLITAVQHYQIICFTPMIGGDEQVKSLSNFINQLEQSAENLLPGAVISWGISDGHEGAKSFHISYKEAKAALDVGNHKREPGHRTHFTDVGFHRALLRLAEDKDMQTLVQQVLGRLLGYDRQKGMDLRQTLRIYLRYQGNVSQTSRKLNLHRQTLMYRLRRIESLTGRSLTNPDDLFLLDLTLRLTESMRTTDVDTI